jgi:hypothetical protein
MLIIFSKIDLERALVACEGFAAKPLWRVGFGGERFHPRETHKNLSAVTQTFQQPTEKYNSNKARVMTAYINHNLKEKS